MDSFENILKNSVKAQGKQLGVPLELLGTHIDTLIFLDVLLALEPRVVKGNEIPIAAVGQGADKKIHLLINPKGMEGLTEKEKLFVLAHEATHVLYAHLSRVKDREPERWNLATDAIINDTLQNQYSSYMSMLRDKITGEKIGIDFETLKKNKQIKPSFEFNSAVHSSEDVYEAIISKGNGGGSKKGKGGKGHGGKGSGGDNKSNGKGGNQITDGNGNWDRHFPIDPENMDSEQKEQLGKIAQKAKNNGYGNIAGNLVRMLDKIARKEFPFRTILEKIFRRERFDFSRMHRRLHIKGHIFPRKRSEHFKVYAAVDVSGSCYDYTEQFLGYVAGLPEFEECYFFDTGIVMTWRKGQAIPNSAKGYGGTDLNPVMQRFAELEKKHSHVKLNFVVLTDGEIPELKVGPAKSNVVIMTTNEEVKSPNGNVYKNIKIRGNE